MKTPGIQINITTLENITIDKNLLAPDFKNKKKSQIDFVEFSEKGIVLEVPTGICQTGNHIMLVLKTKNTGDDIEFNATVKVTGVENLEDNRARADLKLMQFDAHKWKSILKAFDQKQKTLTDLFERMKG